MNQASGVGVQGGEPLEDAGVVGGIGVVVDDAGIGIAELPRGDGVLDAVVQLEEGIERGVGRVLAPRGAVGVEERVGPGGPRLGQAVGARDGGRQPVDRQLVEDRLDVGRGRQDGVGHGLGRREALDRDRPQALIGRHIPGEGGIGRGIRAGDARDRRGLADLDAGLVGPTRAASAPPARPRSCSGSRPRRPRRSGRRS